MKSKYYTTLIALGTFACAAHADISNIFGGLSDADATEIKADAGNLDVVLNPNQTDTSAEAFFKGNDNTISSLKTYGHLPIGISRVEKQQSTSIKRILAQSMPS